MCIYQGRRLGNTEPFDKYTQLSSWNEEQRFNFKFIEVKCRNCAKDRALELGRGFQGENKKPGLKMKQDNVVSHFQIGAIAEMGWIGLMANMSSSEEMRENQNFTPAISQIILAPTIATSVQGDLDGSPGASGNATEGVEDLFYFYELKAIVEKKVRGLWVMTAFGIERDNVCPDLMNPKEIWYPSVKNFNGPQQLCPPPKGTEQFTVLWILFTVIVLGNSSVLVAMFLNKNRKSRMNFFIKQLALADLSVGLLNVLTDIIWRITISWRAGNVACKLIRFSQVCVTYASTYVLVALSIDRYDAITHPMNFSKSWKRARRLVATAWIVSALLSAPMLVLYEEKLIQGQTQCWIELGEPWRWQIYMTLVSMTLFAFPALIIAACYAVIVRTIWVKGSVFTPADQSACVNPETRRASSRGIIPRAKVKTIKMTFVIVIVFILCWSPYIVFDLMQVFGHIPQTQTNIAIATFIQSLAPLNSAANPLIYCMFSTQIFRSLGRIPPFKWFKCCFKSQQGNSTQNRCNTVGKRLHNSCDSMRTLTTSLTVSRRSNKTARVMIVEGPKTALAMSEV